MKHTPFVSIILTAHAEGILIHRTLASIRRAIDQLPSQFQPVEILLHADNPTEETSEYIADHQSTTLKNVSVFTNTFGDLGSSRNFTIQQAHGKYIATIDADDLMSKDWLKKAVEYLESQKEPTIAHSEVTVEFEGANSLVIKHGEIDYNTDTLLSVYANRWNSVIVAPRELMQKFPYTPNSPGFGYEDWHLNSRLIHAKVHNTLIPHTAIFVRRKKMNSEWARQAQSMAVLRANPLLGFHNIRKIQDPFKKLPLLMHDTPKYAALNERVKSYIKQQPLAHKAARYIKKSLNQYRHRHVASSRSSPEKIPQWLQTEWRELHAIERQIFPTEHLIQTITIYDSLTEDHRLAGSMYKLLVDQLRFDSYPYLIFTPWLTKGGADKYTIEYANTIAELTGDPVLVVGTLLATSPWKSKLSQQVDFLDFGIITATASPEIKHRLMEHIIENGNVKAIHVINSEFGYDFVQAHEKYIRATDKKVIVTSFSQSVDIKTGRLYGYSHTHVPCVYEIASLITSDNQSVLDMWASEYGFSKDKLRVHRQPVSTKDYTRRKLVAPRTPLRVLWAARIAPEKLPEVALEVSKKLQDKINIDMYGSIDTSEQHVLDSLPPNVSYKGSYDGFNSLPLDKYDVLLYTSLFDGMPNVILEASASQLPIIASAVGGIPEFITNHHNGSIVSDILNPSAYADVIEDFINNKRGTDYADASFHKIKNSYSHNQYIKSIKEMLEQLELTFKN